MKINGQPEGGQGGGLTPAQEALINQVPNKVNQVRLVTDGSAIRHEGALTPLTFEQIYALVMDNSKYVYIVMDNNIRFRPSAYDGDAIWFDSSFIEEGKPNILRCIINSDNRVDITQIVVASEEYVDEKVAEAGGLDPEQKKAVETLVDSSKGMLYTEDLTPRHINRYDFEDGSTRVVNLDGRIILNRYYELYEFKDLGIYHLGPIVGQFDYNYPMWTDMSGRIYNGQSYKVDLNSMTSEPASLNCMYFDYQNNKCNIFKGQNAVYVYGGNQYQVFDEEAQQFDEPQFYTNDGNLDVYMFNMNQIKFGDRLISIYDNQTYELVEDADGIHPEVVDNPFDFDSAPFTVQGSRMFYIEGIWYYIPNYPYEGTYRLVDGIWERMEMTFPDGVAPFFEGFGVVYENMVISYYASYLFVYNLTDEEKKVTSWVPVGNKAVDLESNQNIGGNKQFLNMVRTPGVSTDEVMSKDMDLRLYANRNINLATLNGFVNLPANTLVNGDPVASKSDTIQSSQMISPGKMRKIYNDITGDPGFSYSVVFNNKLYHDSFNQWIFDGETAVNADSLFPDTYINLITQAKITSSRFFLIHSGYLYELVDDEFVIREEGTHEHSWVFPYEDTLVDYTNGQKLNTSTWEWEDWVGNIGNFYSASRTFVFNGQTYSANEYQLTIFNPDTASFETCVEYIDAGNVLWSNGNHFIHNGHIYVITNGYWSMVDLENRTITDVSGSIGTPESNFICSLNGKVYDMNVGLVNMLYKIEYTKPEFPEADGTYVLKATRVGDQITYTWVIE